ncbi:hypothetical protein [uncultured Roseibium sp.]|uniref:hypothetical protein n=1 Tax=uncultured Roseibium sp. TaxID=1936171 RepID=UPI0032177F56
MDRYGDFCCAYVFPFLFVLLLAIASPARAEGACQDVVDWYRDNDQTPPHIQLAVEPDAPDQKMFEQVHARALLAQLKYELATGTYWGVGKSERDGLIAVLDDPKARFIYTGKANNSIINPYTAAGQTLDGDTIQLHHAAFASDLGLTDGFYPPHKIATTMLHELVHASFYRNSVLHNLNPFKEDVPEAAEEQFKGATACFTEAHIAELDRFLRDPDGYKPQDAAAQAGEPSVSAEAFDPRDLQAVFYSLEALVNAQDAQKKALDDACHAAGTWNEFLSWTREMEATGFKPDISFAPALEAEQLKLQRLETLIAKIDALSRTATVQSENVCKEFAQEPPRLDVAKADAATTREAAVNARELYGQAKQLFDDLTVSLSNNKDLPNLDVAVEKVTADSAEKISALKDQCLKPVNEMLHAADRADANDKAAEINAKKTLALQLLEDAEKAGYEHADIYRARYEELSAISQKHGQLRDSALSCRSNAGEFKDLCTEMEENLNTLREQISLEFARRYRAALAKRSQQLDLANGSKSKADGAFGLVYYAAIKAEKCLRAIEAKEQDPKADTETGQPIDPGKAQVQAPDCQAEKSELEAASARIDGGDLSGADSALSGVDVAACPDLDPLVSASRTRVAELADRLIAQGRAALESCDLKNAIRERILALPASAKRDALAEEWKGAYAHERAARDLIRQAIALNKNGQLPAATAKLHEAQGVPPYCASTRTKLAGAIAKADGRMADAEAVRITEMVRVCNFKDSRALIKNLPESARRAELVDLWNRSRNAEIDARRLLKTAMSLKDAGQVQSARTKLAEARGKARCKSTLARIDTLGKGLVQPSAPTQVKDNPRDKPKVASQSPDDFLVWVHEADRTCCKNTGGGTLPYAFHASQRRALKDGAIVLGTFPTHKEMMKWVCARKLTKAAYYPVGVYGIIGPYTVSRIPCDVVN